ncbi:DEKNAAC102521 [Brettanomyces naardenensis]|uniref:DNA mismatch repair protein n=1 Tax=Brettanomyces naardenensis TaxID=13370 RepID=A0A448YL14_BRENA|nr:DEKNAAC102521 [Brettanomyces naardenensis]
MAVQTKQMKQASLLSFFSKAKAKPKEVSRKKEDDKKKPESVESITPTSSSPVKEKLVVKDVSSPITSTEAVETPKSIKKTIKGIQPQSMLPSSPLSTLSSGRKVRKVNYSETSDDDDDEEDVLGSRRKRRRVVEDDEEDDDSEDYKFDEEVAEEQSKIDDADFVDVDMDDDLGDDDVIIEDDDDDDDDVIEMNDLGRAKKERTVERKVEKKVKTETEHDEKLSDGKGHPSLSDTFSAGSTVPDRKKSLNNHLKDHSNMTPQRKFAKENGDRYQWLVHVKDSQGREETDPEYDPRSLYIPKSAWSKFTAFETQYWTIKAKMWDTVVFFKKGKFFELYERDADIAHQKFDLKLAGTGRANMRLAGIPEMSFDYWAKRFVDEGYKVAKVDQKESMLAKEMRERNSKGKKASKVIQRELECVLTCGTLTDENMLTDDMAKYCLAVKEETNADNTKTFGVSFIDTSTGMMQITQFNDDPECGKLETLLAQVQPMEVLVEKSKVSPLVMKILRFNSHGGAMFNFLKSGDEFWDHEVAFEELTRGKYFEASNLDDLSHYPAVLVKYYKSEKNMAFSAFGALLWYLRSLKLDSSTISMGNVVEYDPFKSSFANATMRLDGVTLQNLEVFGNSFDQSDKGTLFRLLNRGVTAFGKRAFRNWVVHPLVNKKKLDERFDSVELLMNDGELRSLVEKKLSKLPDLERLLARVHSGSLKVKDFSKVVEGFETILSLAKILKDTDSNDDHLGGFLGELISEFPSMLEERVGKWTDAFDRHLAYTEGKLVPEVGVEPEFDASNAKVKSIEDELEDILRGYRRELQCQELGYKDYGKEVYVIEVPKRAVSRVPSDWQQMSATAKTKRYWSPRVKKLVRELLEARELHKILCESLQQKMYARFDKDYAIWADAVKCIAQLDCLISLVRASESLGSPLCRPEFVDSDRASVQFKELRHPCFIPGGSSGTRDFIPNDVSLGVDGEGQIGLLTGANAAGKSTLLRMTGIAVIMAQIGCYVPASEAKIVPIDAIMTRLGANDNIMQGKSTFFVELSETKRMLANATPRSLIILDELGRGGSSSDGFAIAEAVLHHIATHVQSVGFFATHYGTLGQSFAHHPRIRPLRMGIIVDEASRNITFLYKLEPGKSNGSFGMHVASMCGIPEEIVGNAEVAAKTHEHTSKLRRAHQSEGDTVPLGLQSDFSWIEQDKGIEATCAVYNEDVKKTALSTIFQLIDSI